MPFTQIPSLHQWLQATAHRNTGKPDRILDYIDVLIQQNGKSPGAFQDALTTCNLFFTCDYWLKENKSPLQNPIHNVVKDLYVFLAHHLSAYFKCSINALPRELELTFGREMTSLGRKVDLGQQAAKPYEAARPEEFRLIFRAGRAYQIPASGLKKGQLVPVNSADYYESGTGLIMNGDLWRDGTGFFVLTMGREIYMMKHAAGNAKMRNGIYHSAYTGGQPVMCAGSMKIVGGIVTLVRNDSGHYKPQDTNLVMLLQTLEMQGVALEHIRVADYRGRDPNPPTAKEFLKHNGDWRIFEAQRAMTLAENQLAYQDYQDYLKAEDAKGNHVDTAQPRGGARNVPWKNGRPVMANVNARMSPPPVPDRTNRGPLSSAQPQTGLPRPRRPLPPIPQRQARPLPPVPPRPPRPAHVPGTLPPGYNIQVPTNQ
jgi:hypothetical protein